jgi:hypothetical protein
MVQKKMMMTVMMLQVHILNGGWGPEFEEMQGGLML